MASELQTVLAAVQRVEDKLDEKIDKLETRVRDTENKLTRLFAIGTIGGSILAFLGIKY